MVVGRLQHPDHHLFGGPIENSLQRPTDLFCQNLKRYITAKKLFNVVDKSTGMECALSRPASGDPLAEEGIGEAILIRRPKEHLFLHKLAERGLY